MVVKDRMKRKIEGERIIEEDRGIRNEEEIGVEKEMWIGDFDYD